MSITREEAIEYFESLLKRFEEMYETETSYWGKAHTETTIEATRLALTALRPVSREQVEKMRGEWVKRHKCVGGFRRVKGVDDMGEQHEITVDERCEYDDLYCSKCGKQSPDNFLNFCGYCGAPMTDEAVDILLKRLEALHENIYNG